jgi:hypothetical protein
VGIAHQLITEKLAKVIKSIGGNFILKVQNHIIKEFDLTISKATKKMTIDEVT